VRTRDGKLEGVSNPVWVEREPERRVYYGDLHQHAYIDDGRGAFLELYLYARRVGLLDFGALSPHHMDVSVTGPRLNLPKRYPRDHWPEIKSVNRMMNGWRGLVTIPGYEYSVATPAGGHHNIYFNADDPPSTMQIDPDDPAAPIAKMLRTLRLVEVPTLVIPHIGGGPPDWSHATDSRIERLFEVASVHGVFEESWQKHLETGLRLGAIAAGDTHTTAMGNAYPGLIYVMSNGLAGVWAQAKSRDSIWRSMHERRTFGVTNGQRILMDFRVNGEPMGGEIPSGQGQGANIEARISGTAPLLRVEVLKNANVIHSIHPARKTGSRMRLVWGDNLYQRRAAIGLRSGEALPEKGEIRLERPVHLDQAFEQVRQAGTGISWTTAAVSNDRDGFVADISGASGDLRFRLDDADTMGVFEVRIPLSDLRRDGFFRWSQAGKAAHPYLEKMGVKPAFFVEADLLDANGPRDIVVKHWDQSPIRPGDYFRLRIEQVDTNKAWSSPVWGN
ncbi:MAG: DUF3604 domain-containing protein, partial [Bryobacteraceae bacterium]